MMEEMLKLPPSNTFPLGVVDEKSISENYSLLQR
jgi:hypothetical protein